MDTSTGERAQGAGRDGGKRGGQVGADPPYPHLVSASGQPSIRIVGLNRKRFGDVYHWLMTLSWPRFLLWWMALYFGANLLFGFLYWLQPGGVAQARPHVFSDAFFFSVQTLGSIGYGQMWPRSLYAHSLVTAEAFTSLALAAIGTGLIFARVSRPTARVMFSRHAVVITREDQPTLMFRAGNVRMNQILEADVSVSLAQRLFTREGVEFRTFITLNTGRSHAPLCGRPCPVMPHIHETTPLNGPAQASLEACEAELVIVMSGVDDTFAQRIHVRHSYLPHEIVWDRRMADIFLRDEKGARYLDYTRFHDLADLATAEIPAQD